MLHRLSDHAGCVNGDGGHAIDRTVQRHQRDPRGEVAELSVAEPARGKDGSRGRLRELLERCTLSVARLLRVDEDLCVPGVAEPLLGSADDVEVERVGDVGDQQRHVPAVRAGLHLRRRGGIAELTR